MTTEEKLKAAQQDISRITGMVARAIQLLEGDERHCQLGGTPPDISKLIGRSR